MVSWVGARAALWDGSVVAVAQPEPRKLAAPQSQAVKPAEASTARQTRRPRTMVEPLAQPTLTPPSAPLVAPTLTLPLRDALPVAPATQAAQQAPMPPKVAAGHQELPYVGMSMLPSDPAVAMAAPKPAFPVPPAVK